MVSDGDVLDRFLHARVPLESKCIAETCQEEAFGVWKGSATASAWQILPKLVKLADQGLQGGLASCSGPRLVAQWIT